jgi:hypothetical protein
VNLVAAELATLRRGRPIRPDTHADVELDIRALRAEHHEFARTIYALGNRLVHLIVADLEPEALQATSQIVSLSERRLRQTDPDGGQAA